MTADDRLITKTAAQIAAEELAQRDDAAEEWPSGALWTGKPIELDVLWYPKQEDCD